MFALILLVMAGCAWAQPDWYPVWTHTYMLKGVEVTVHGDTAQIVCPADSGTSLYVAFNFEERQLVHVGSFGPTFFEWPHNSLIDLAMVSSERWVCLRAADNWSGGYGTFRFETWLHTGIGDLFEGELVGESYLHNVPNNPSGGWTEGHSLRVRNGRVAVAYIATSATPFDVQYNVEYREYENDSLNQTVSASTSIYAFWNEPLNRAIAVPIGADSVVIYSDFGFDGDQTLYLGPLNGFNEQPNYRNLICGDSRYLRTLEVTNGGRIIAGFADNRLREIVVNGAEASCTPFAELPASWSPSWAFHPSYGFAAVNVNAGYLTIARIDTNGVAVQPPGVIHVVVEDHDIVNADIAITDDGRVVCVWTEHQEWDHGAHILKIAWVDWATYLDSADENTPQVPREFALSAYPNPFNSSVTIRYALPSAGEVSLRVFDVQGRLVTTLLDERVAAGEHSVAWSPETLSSGVYFAQLTSAQSVRNTKLLYLK